MRPALRKCAEPGCYMMVEGKRCRRHQKKEENRQTAYQRGYDRDWATASKAYRDTHPLCVRCLLLGRLRDTHCTDHIIPLECAPELKYDPDNWAALCKRCHGFKTQKEPRTGWVIDRERVVVCGVPGVGKTTWAKQRVAPYFDADELNIKGWEAVVQAREWWISKHPSGPCTVIVASTVTAATVAARLRGIVKHLTDVRRAWAGLTPADA